MPSFYSFGSKWSFKNNKTTVRNSLTSDVNAVNIDQAVWDGSNNFTSVGTNGRPSYYGCYDMNGNVFEWNDLNQTVSANRGIRGGFWGCCNRGPYALGSDDSNITFKAADRYDTFGLRIASLSNPDSLPNFVLIGDSGNSSETIPNRWTGPVTIGGVSYEYYINKFKVTNDEYALFLNSVASTDTYGLLLSVTNRGILRTGSSGSYVYTVKTNYGNKPFTYINWFTCARYCNWLHNGKPSGAQNSSTTEDGAYLLNGATTGNAIVKKGGAKYFLPTQNEWYKAAYYKGGGANRGYWRYATQSNDYPRAILADVNGNGTLRPTSFRPTNSTGSDVTTETITDNIFNVGLSLNYEQVASSGVTRIVPITSSIPNLPANFTLSNNIGKYNISTTSSVSGNIDIKFVLPTSLSLTRFNSTKIFHTNSSGITSDATITSGINAPNYSTRTKYARVTGFSDFHIIPSTDIVENQAVPSSLVGSVGNGYVDLSWSMSSTTDIIDYNIKYSTNSGASWIDYEHIPQTTLSIRVEGLVNNTNYLFQIASISDEGVSSLSSSSSSLTPLSIVSTAPSNLVVEAALNSVNLTWTVPSDNGGSDIVNYIVQYSKNGGSSWTTSADPLYLFSDDVSSTRSLKITNLDAVSHIFRVAAVNNTGTSDYSSSSNSVTPSSSSSPGCDLVITEGSFTTTTSAPTTTTTTTTTAAPTTTTTTTIPPNTYNVTNNNAGNYAINGSSNPTLTLTAGQTYTFNINAVGHPFWIKTNLSTGTGNAYNDGVTNNGTDSGTITFVVPYNAPVSLYYNCQFHSSMAGNIDIVGTTTTTTVAPTTTTAAPTTTTTTTTAAPTTTTTTTAAPTTTTTTAEPITTTAAPTTTTAAPIPISPLSIANGFIDVIRSDTISEAEYSNAVLANGYLSVLRVNDTISEAEYPNAVLANGFISTLYIDTI